MKIEIVTRKYVDLSPIDEDDCANDEWAYEEFRHMIEMVTNYPARWEFDNGQ